MSQRVPDLEPVTHYDRRLNLFDGTMLVIGGIIGAGIFLNPAIVAERAGSYAMTLLIWGIGGAVALAGAFCFGELGARRPLAGGSYVYLRDTLGGLPAFLYGWTYLFVVNTGGSAAVAVTFAGYFCRLFELPTDLIAPTAIGAIVLLSYVNFRGIRPGATTLNVLTVLRLVALTALIMTGVVWAARLGIVIEREVSPTRGSLLGVIGVALLPVLFSYGGWQHANHVAGEIANPARNLPRALTWGVMAVVTVYMLANVAYLNVLGVEGLATSTAPAADTMIAVLGPVGGTFITAGIVCSTFGFLHLSIMAGPRIYQAMADDKVFFDWVAKLHPKYRTPSGAIWLQAGWAVLLTLSGSYGQLLDYVVFGDWIFFGLAVFTLFLYRRKDAEGEHPRSPAWGYPWTPLMFIGAAIFAVVSSVASNPTNAAIGTLLIGAGIPIYYLWSRKAPATGENN